MKSVSGYLLAGLLAAVAAGGGLTSSISSTVGNVSGFDASTTKTDGVTSVTAGSSTTYTVVVSNTGPGSTAGTFVDNLPPELINVAWTCETAGGATCGAANGTGSISNNISLPGGGSVTHTIMATVSPSASGTVSNTASFSVVGDSEEANNSATDTDTIQCAATQETEQVDDDDDGGENPVGACDSDGDGLPDPKEETIGTNPNDADTDDDGLPDGREWGYKSTYTCLNLFRKDSDGEGIGDFTELNGVTVNQYYTTNTDRPGTKFLIGKVRTNPCKQDTEGDGLTDWREAVGSAINQQVVRFVKDGGIYQLTSRKTHPLKRDTDDDGLADKLEITGAANWRFDRRKSDPTTADTDWGGGKDGREVYLHHTDPTWAGR